LSVVKITLLQTDFSEILPTGYFLARYYPPANQALNEHSNFLFIYFFLVFSVLLGCCWYDCW